MNFMFNLETSPQDFSLQVNILKSENREMRNIFGFNHFE